MAPETGFLRASVGENEVFSSKNPVSLVGCVSPVKGRYGIACNPTQSSVIASTAQQSQDCGIASLCSQ
ncbi:hypothetical protein [Phormidium nigroviride]